MGFWKKEYHTHFNRNESGRVTSVERDGRYEKNSEMLEKEYKSSHPSRWDNIKRSMNEHATDRMILHAKEKEAHRRGYERGRVQRAEHMGFASGRGLMPVQQQRTRVVHVHHHARKSKAKHRSSRPKRPLHLNFMTGRWE
jgi:hypothetical protein